ncbi:MAG: glycosyltransferase, partial [Ardenticatenia bacterium]
PWRIMQAVRATRPDVVLFNIQFASFGDRKIPATLGLMTPLLVRMLGIPSVVLLHNIMETVDLKKAGFATNPLVEWVIRTAGTVVTRMILMADLVAVTIPKYVEILEAKYKAKNVILAPHGSFDEVAQPSLDLPDGPRRILAFGKFGTYKKVEMLIEAFRLLQERLDMPLELVIAGTNSPNAPGYLERVREQYHDVPNIRFTGYVPEEDVPRIFSEAAVVVFPYTATTGSSGVLHQAGNYGKAAVLPDIGDLAELVREEGYAGEFFDPGDIESLAHAIQTFLLNDEYRREVGWRNYLASKGLGMDDVVDWYLLHFQTLIAQRHGGETAQMNKQESQTVAHN